MRWKRVRRFLRKRKLELAFLVILLGLVIYSYDGNKSSTFKSEPALSEASIIFELRKTPTTEKIEFFGIGAKAYVDIRDFCDGVKCRVPLVIGGNVTLRFTHNSNVLFERLLTLPHLKFFCDSTDWTTRICRIKDVCFSAGTFSVTSPYPMDFDSHFVTLGARPPPVDLPTGRVRNALGYQSEMPVGAPYVRGISNYFSISEHTNKQWHLFFDLLIPIWATLSRDGKFDRSRHLFFTNAYCEAVPNLVASLTDNQVLCLDRQLCFEELEMGMVKVMNRTANQRDPPYEFPAVDVEAFQRTITDFFEIPWDRRKKERTKVVLVERGIVNVEEVSAALKEVFQESDVDVFRFDEITIKKQIKIVRDADVLVGVHGDALAMMLFMVKNTSVIEIMPYKLTCRNWFEKAAEFCGLRYHVYHPQSREESVADEDRELEMCFAGKIPCESSTCIGKLKSQSVKVNVGEFVREISK